MKLNLIHQTAIEPTLSDSEKPFIQLKRTRSSAMRLKTTDKVIIGDCVVKCGSAFERRDERSSANRDGWPVW